MLLDCGLDISQLSEFTARIMQHNITAVLVSYPDIDHIGALPYLYGKNKHELSITALASAKADVISPLQKRVPGSSNKYIKFLGKNRIFERPISLLGVH